MISGFRRALTAASVRSAAAASQYSWGKPMGNVKFILQSLHSPPVLSDDLSTRSTDAPGRASRKANAAPSPAGPVPMMTRS